MILEVAILDIKPGLAEEFEAAFELASTIIASASGVIAQLPRIENEMVT
jgi:heme-degrading monooxygenase HmoA